MSFLSSVLNFFGTKSDRDMKELAPNVKEILAHKTHFDQLSNDELRQKTQNFRLEISLIIEEFNTKIQDLKIKTEKEQDRDQS